MFYRFSKIAFATRRHRQDSRLECGSISETLMKCAIRVSNVMKSNCDVRPREIPHSTDWHVLLRILGLLHSDTSAPCLYTSVFVSLPDRLLMINLSMSLKLIFLLNCRDFLAFNIFLKNLKLRNYEGET